jgi:hypothetical protein
MAEPGANQRRRDAAAAAIGAYADREPEEGRRPAQLRNADSAADAISELLCDLRHLGDEFGLDWEELCARAGRYYSEERERHVVEVTCEGFQIRDLADDRLRADVWPSREQANEACAELNQLRPASPGAI